MRVGLIADIHGNVVALEAALERLERAGYDRLVCLGDVASTGPDPTGALERVAALGCDVVMGNADAFLLQPSYEEALRAIGDERMADIEMWCAHRLDDDHLDVVRGFHPTVEVAHGANTMLCYHGTPHSFDGLLYAWSSADELDAAFAETSAGIYAGGHTHWPFLRRHALSVVLNPGSVGMAYDRTSPTEEVRFAPWAEYAVVDLSPDGPSVELRRAPFDPEEVAAAAERSGMPHAEWWAQEWRSTRPGP